MSFNVCDATDYDAMMALPKCSLFTKAVANMAVMDITDIKSLFHAVYDLLVSGGVLVFATSHPCFTFPNGDYFTSKQRN